MCEGTVYIGASGLILLHQSEKSHKLSWKLIYILSEAYISLGILGSREKTGEIIETKPCSNIIYKIALALRAS